MKTLFTSAEQRILEFEARLLTTTDDTERSTLIDALAELHITHENLKAMLTGDDPAINS